MRCAPAYGTQGGSQASGGARGACAATKLDGALCGALAEWRPRFGCVGSSVATVTALLLEDADAKQPATAERHCEKGSSNASGDMDATWKTQGHVRHAE